MSAIPANPAEGSVADRVDLGAQLRWLTYLHRIGATTEQVEAATRPILALVERAAGAVADREAEHYQAAEHALRLYRNDIAAGASESDARAHALGTVARTTTTGHSDESVRQRDAAVLAEPVVEAHIDAAPTPEVGDLLIRTAAAQQALRKLASGYADTANDVIGLYNEGQDKSGYDRDQAAAAAMTEASTGIPALYENAYYDLDYRAGQRAQQRAETTAPALDGKAIADIAREATAHNFGRTVWNVDSPEFGAVRVRMSSWPREQEASAALREHGYTVHYDGTTLVITDRAPHEQAQATIAQARGELRQQIAERQRAVDEGLRYARLYLAVRGSNAQADAERVRRAAAERYADSASPAPITATWIEASPAIDHPSLVAAAADLHAAAALRRGQAGAVDHAAHSYLAYRSQDMGDIQSSDNVRRDAADDVQREIDFAWRDTYEGFLGLYASTEHAEQVQQRAHTRIEVQAGERARVDLHEFAQPVPGRPDDLDQLRRRQIDVETPAATDPAEFAPLLSSVRFRAQEQQLRASVAGARSPARQTERTRDSASLLGANPAAPIHPQLIAEQQRTWGDAANRLRDAPRLPLRDWRLRAALDDLSARRYNGIEDQVQALETVIARSGAPRHHELHTAALILRDTAPTEDNRDAGSFVRAARPLGAAGAGPAALTALHAAMAANEPLAGIDASDIYIHAPQLFQQWTTEQNPANRERVAERIATVVDLARKADELGAGLAEGTRARELAESLDRPLNPSELDESVPSPQANDAPHRAAANTQPPVGGVPRGATAPVPPRPDPDAWRQAPGAGRYGTGFDTPPDDGWMDLGGYERVSIEWVQRVAPNLYAQWLAAETPRHQWMIGDRISQILTDDQHADLLEDMAVGDPRDDDDFYTEPRIRQRDRYGEHADRLRQQMANADVPLTAAELAASEVQPHQAPEPALRPPAADPAPKSTNREPERTPPNSSTRAEQAPGSIPVVGTVHTNRPATAPTSTPPPPPPPGPGERIVADQIGVAGTAYIGTAQGIATATSHTVVTDNDSTRPYVAETRGNRTAPTDVDPGRPEALEDRWAPSARAVDPRVVADPHWPALARSLDRLDAAGHDVENLLREVTAQRALPAGSPARSLDYRLADAAPEATAGPGQPWTAAPTPASPSTPTTPVSAPQIGHGGPAR